MGILLWNLEAADGSGVREGEDLATAVLLGG